MNLIVGIYRFFAARILTIIGLVALCVVVWILGPKIALGEQTPLASSEVRVLVIAGIISFWLLLEFVRYLSRRRYNRKIIAELAESSAMVGGTSVSDEDLVRDRFMAAVELLNDRMDQSGRRTNMYDLPWYLVIGASGSGKSQMLRNSGLEFLSDQEGGFVDYDNIQPTEHLDWWLSEDAVFIDTAGRYTTQDVNPPKDKAAWRSLRDVLKGQRERRPLNGIIVAISAEQLAGSEDGLTQLADSLKARLVEVMGTFKSSIPVYVMVTKSDLILGFSEFFNGVGARLAEQTFGVSLEYNERGLDAKGQKILTERLRKLVANVQSMADVQIEGEVADDRRRAIFRFPMQMAFLTEPLNTIVSGIFRASRYSTDLILRGVFFVSAESRGLPNDFVGGETSNRLGFRAALPAAQAGVDDSAFLRATIRKIILPEQDLAGLDRNLERKLFALHALSYTFIALLTGVFLFVWWFSTEHADNYDRIAAKHFKAYNEDIARYNSNPTLENAIDTASNFAQSEYDSTSEFIWMSLLKNLGLAAPIRILPYWRTAYDKVLDEVVIPAIIKETGEDLRQSIDAEDSINNVRDLLRLYVGYAQPDLYDENGFLAWFKRELDNIYPLDDRRQEISKRITRPLNEALKKPLNIDKSLADRGRAYVFAIPPAEQLYDTLRRRAGTRGIGAVTMQTLIGTKSSLYFDESGAAGSQSVRGLNTENGFYQVFVNDTPNLINEVNQDDPLLGDMAQSEDNRTLVTELTALYTKDYIEDWKSFLDGIRLMQFSDIYHAEQALQVLSNEKDSPIKKLLLATAQNTTLPAEKAKGLAGLAQKAQAAVGQKAAAVEGQAPGQTTGNAQSGALSQAGEALQDLGPFSTWPGVEIANEFRSLNAKVVSFEGSEPDYPMIQSAIARVYASFNVIVAAPDVSKAAFDEVAKRAEEGSGSNLVRLSTLAAQQPEPLRRILNAIVAQSWSVLVKESRNYIDERWEAEVLPICEQAIMARYPAKADANDNIAINDFTTFFAPGGTIDKFFKTHLEAYVDTSGETWVLRKLNGMSLGISPAGLKVFEEASKIRKAYFGANNPAPKMSFTLTPSFLDAQAAKVVIQENKKIDSYQHEPPREFGFSWPSEEPAVDLSVSLFDLQNASSSYRTSGAWAWFRLFEENDLKKQASGDRYSLGFKLRGMEARYDLKIDGMTNPLSQPNLTGFACPALL